ncbi:hypothetical protein ACJX0J_012365, partial [Zea mays]
MKGKRFSWVWFAILLTRKPMFQLFRFLGVYIQTHVLHCGLYRIITLCFHFNALLAQAARVHTVTMIFDITIIFIKYLYHPPQFFVVISQGVLRKKKLESADVRALMKTLE